MNWHMRGRDDTAPTDPASASCMCVHTDPPTPWDPPWANTPATQASLDELPAGERVAAGQSWHAPTPVAPDKSEYLPTSQSRHVASDVAPRASEYLPRTQVAHEPSGSPYLPAAHCAQVLPSLV